MNAKSTLHLDPVRVARFAEIAFYAIQATLLIGGHVFFRQGPFTLQDTAFISLGIAFGLMALCGATPLSNSLRRTARSDAAEVPQRHISGVVTLSDYAQRDKAANSDSEPRRAA
ncbi:MAG: hypothetical protein FD130_1793 [Halothiobacillaceae bacterium]|nr:MAG: hypothetical protein FD130_1793 [Halothiobacillaceae bacterium]